jgi:hypothetical protein
MSTRRAQRKKPLSLLGAILRAASQVRLLRSLTVFGSVTGMKHMPIGAFRQSR